LADLFFSQVEIIDSKKTVVERADVSHFNFFDFVGLSLSNTYMLRVVSTLDPHMFDIQTQSKPVSFDDVTTQRFSHFILKVLRL